MRPFEINKNKILAALPQSEIERLLPHLEPCSLTVRQTLFRSGDLIAHIYFPFGSVVSLINFMEDGSSVEVGIIGCEGIVGLPALLGAPVAYNSALVQHSEVCARIRAEVLKAEFDRGGILQETLLRYTMSFIIQVSQVAACNRLHLLERRLCRWLLMMHDRVSHNQFQLTHEFLSHMLGTPRPQISIAASILQKNGLIRYRRGNLSILDRKGIEETACECYAILAGDLD